MIDIFINSVPAFDDKYYFNKIYIFLKLIFDFNYSHFQEKYEVNILEYGYNGIAWYSLPPLIPLSK